jgi:dephospho-CoA kinase
MIIGLTGTNASGKTSVVNYLVSKGFNYFSLSDVIRDELTERGLDHSRENLRIVGNDLRKKYGASILAIRICQKISSGNTVIDSIRNTSEVKTLRELNQFTFIAVDASIEVRFERAKKRGRLESAATLDEFREAEDKEKSQDTTAQNLDQCIKLADYRINNEGQPEQLYLEIDNILTKLNAT